MNPEQAESIVRLMTGYWPGPVTPEEALALGQELSPHEYRDAETAVRLLTNQPRQYRPNATELAAAMRGVRNRRLESQPALPQPEPADPVPWFGRCREALTAAKPWARLKQQARAERDAQLVPDIPPQPLS